MRKNRPSQSDAAVVTANSHIAIYFALRLENGELVDGNYDAAPARLQVGDGNLPAGFEKHLVGLAQGAHAHFTIPPEEGFGQYNTSNVQRIDRDRFGPDVELNTGLMMAFADAAGHELPGVILEQDERWVTVDFNHPLAGKTLDFEVSIVAIE